MTELKTLFDTTKTIKRKRQKKKKKKKKKNLKHDLTSSKLWEHISRAVSKCKN